VYSIIAGNDRISIRRRHGANEYASGMAAAAPFLPG
jgi:hypothetical protein